MTQDYFVTCPRGLEELLFEELKTLNCEGLRQTSSGVYFSGPLMDAYRVCLWSRFANRVLLPLTQCRVNSDRDLYNAVAELLWERDLEADGTLYIDFLGTNDAIRNTQFGAQVVKDGIVDRIRTVHNTRPSIDKNQPDLRINVRLAKDIAHVSIDLSGESLHRRSYRVGQGGAPLKENLAAAILKRSGWNKTANEGRTIIDPMCGSATFLIEAAYMLADIAPGILRKYFGFFGWKRFNETDWLLMYEEAQQRKAEGLKKLCSNKVTRFYGYDEDFKVIECAKRNIEAAGLTDVIYVQQQALSDFSALEKCDDASLEPKGLIVCNPPYGERLGDINALRDDYLLLAQKSKTHFPGWNMAVFTGNAELGKSMRLRPSKKYKFFNGAIASELLLFNLLSEKEAVLRKDLHQKTVDSSKENDAYIKHSSKKELSAGAQMVENRLRKNQKRLKKWLSKEKITCYRLYDADMPEYAAAIDVYGDQIHVQEYQAPKKIDEEKAKQRFDDLIAAVFSVFECSPDHVSIKTRKRHKGSSQYEKNFKDESFVEKEKSFFKINEGAIDLFVNLHDYLDTGLFLDHRPLRRKILQTCKDKSVLNLFCYTASITTAAALGGARSSVSVDLSNTYLSWAARNFSLNNIKPAQHQLEQADVLTWLNSCRQGFDVIVLDPPSFSNSKKMTNVLDIQKDHVSLVKRCMDLLNPNGVLYFSNNLRSFKLDQILLKSFDVKDIRAESLDPDFERNPKIHSCWEIRSVRH